LAGNVTLAVKLYRQLEHHYPSSLEAHVSWVVLGRLYLERLDDPSAALSCFNRYLEKSGPNQPEALIGRARSLRALGRTGEEVQTLRRLVEKYPDSFYATPDQTAARDPR
jgi:tetratricopeptide (TPR) repeat protein